MMHGQGSSSAAPSPGQGRAAALPIAGREPRCPGSQSGGTASAREGRRAALACSRDCQGFRVGRGIVGKKETLYGPTETAADPGRDPGPVAGRCRCQDSLPERTGSESAAQPVLRRGHGANLHMSCRRWTRFFITRYVHVGHQHAAASNSLPSSATGDESRL